MDVWCFVDGCTHNCGSLCGLDSITLEEEFYFGRDVKMICIEYEKDESYKEAE